MLTVVVMRTQSLCLSNSVEYHDCFAMSNLSKNPICIYEERISTKMPKPMPMAMVVSIFGAYINGKIGICIGGWGFSALNPCTTNHIL